MEWNEVPPTLRRLRESAGFTQTQVAELLGVTKAAVSFWENQKRGPTPDQVGAYAGLFGHKLVLELVPESWSVTVSPPPENVEREPDQVRERSALELSAALSTLSEEDVDTVVTLARILGRLPRAARVGFSTMVHAWARDLESKRAPKDK